MEIIATNKTDKTLINEEIREKEIRVIGNDGEQLGIISSREALAKAEEQELDLVMISPTANPPVCRIMDYGKFTYEQSKKVKESRKKQKIVNLKEVRLSAHIEDHDMNVKAKNTLKFLAAGDKVKVTIRFKGREADYSHIGQKILEAFYEKVKDSCSVEKPAKMEGRSIIMILAPNK